MPHEPGFVAEGVVFGLEEHLFLADGGHHVTEYATGSRFPDPRSFDSFRDNLLARTHKAASVHAKYLHIIFPDKQSVLSELFPLPVTNRLGADYLASCPEVADLVLYPLDTLRGIGGASFLHTDTHLTDLGTLSVTADIVRRLTGDDHADGFKSMIEAIADERHHTGDLGRRFTPAHASVERFSRGPQDGLWFHNEMHGGNNGIVDIRLNPNSLYDGRVIYFGDSFGRENCRFLSPFFEEVVFLRSRFFHPEMLDQLGSDILITQNVERYLDSCQSDDERPPFMIYPYLQEADYRPSREFVEAFSAMLSYPRRPYAGFWEKLGLNRKTRTDVRLQLNEVKIDRVDVTLSADERWPETVLDDLDIGVGITLSAHEDEAVSACSSVVETESPWRHTPPEFVVESSEEEREHNVLWGHRTPMHATLIRHAKDCLLVASNVVIEAGGIWHYDSLRFRAPDISYFTSSAFSMIYNGPAPRIYLRDEKTVVGFQKGVDAAVRAIDRPVFLATATEPDNWGRWITQVLPKLARYRDDHSDRMLLCRAALPWQREWIDLMQIETRCVINHDPGHAYVLRDLVRVQHTTADLAVTPSEHAVLADLSNTIVAGSIFGERIFVSRRSDAAQRPSYRVLQNEAKLATVLERLGFAIVEPSKMTISDQIATFRAARIVVGLGGAGMFNVAFCRPGAKVVTIESTDLFVNGHTALFAALGLQYGVVFGQEDLSDDQQVHRRWTVDIEQVVSAVLRFM